MQELNRSEIHVQVEFEAQPKEDIARVLISGNAGVTECAKKDGVDVVAQMPECCVGQCLSGLDVVIGGIWKAFPRE